MKLMVTSAAEDFLAIHAPQAALAALSQKTDFDPLHDLKLKVRALIQSRNLGGASRYIRMLDRMSYADDEGRAIIGTYFVSEGRADQAEIEFRRSAILNPSRAESIAALASLKRSTGNGLGAEQGLRRALIANPLNSNSYNSAAVSAFQSNDLEKAEALTKAAAVIKPAVPPVYRLRHYIAQKRGDFSSSMRDLRRNTVLDPLEDSKYPEWFAYHTAAQDDDRALASWKKYTVLRPRNYFSYNLIRSNRNWERLVGDIPKFLEKLAAFGLPIKELYLSIAKEQYRSGKLESAEKLLTAYIEKYEDPTSEATINLGIVFFKQGAFDRAETTARALIRAQKKNPRAWILLAYSAEERGDPDKALRIMRQAIQYTKDDASAWSFFGDLYLRQEKHQGAIKAFNHALFHDPQNPVYYARLANLYEQVGKEQRAADVLQIGLRLGNTNMATFAATSKMLTQAGQWEAALEKAKIAYVADPQNYDAVDALTAACLANINPTDAHKYAKRLYLDTPNSPQVLSMYAVTMARAGEVERAIAILRDALVKTPGSTRLVKAYTIVAALTQTPEIGRKLTRSQMLLRDPSAGSLSGFGMTELSFANWSEGFDLFEFGFEQVRRGRGPQRKFQQARWNGEDLSGKTIIVHSEQGVGDEIMFATVLNDIIALAKHVYIEVTPRLVPLFQRSFPQATVYDYRERVDFEKRTDIDYYVPIGSLGRYARRSTEMFGRNRPHLHVDPSAAQELRRRYVAAANGRPIIGIGWRGGSVALRRQRRSFDLRTMGSLVADQRFQFVSVQYGDVADEIDAVNSEFGADIIHDPDVDPLRNMDLSAAQIAACDLIISASNAGVHTAGSIGVPCWNIIPIESDWRWTHGRTDVLWYPGMRLYRQTAWNDWHEVIERIQRDLEASIDSGALRGTRHQPDPTLDWASMRSK
ncbi:tetratricopeptide repeat protein [Thalassobaculum salexigens]|uniref:tetratricopeptide repeat protein n=1 Tax=Thalassobaculum salexigens TaxID=455360 RepID=UPI00248ECDF3|nr:tetratricopeptide repeat protein [Thalassobaculum salexigens]